VERSEILLAMAAIVGAITEGPSHVEAAALLSSIIDKTL